jgi:hypothetical protein
MFVVERYQRAARLLRYRRRHGVSPTQAGPGSQGQRLLTERLI